MKKLIHHNRYFIIPFLIFFLVEPAWFFIYGKEQAHYILNQISSLFLGVFFKGITYLEDGLMYIPVLVLLLKYKWASSLCFEYYY